MTTLRFGWPLPRRLRSAFLARGARVFWLAAAGGLPAVLAATAAPPAKTELQDKVTQYGITWTFERPCPVGRFATGDWFVIGPARVAAVSPAPTAERHGSVVNPPAGDKQGYDRRMSGFDASLRASFPLLLQPGQSLVSVDSVEKLGEKTPDTVEGHYCRGPLRTAAVLTCLAAPPPADAFRPGFCGVWKEMFAISQLKLDRLPELAPPVKPPASEKYARFLERVWLDHQREWVNREMHPLENMPDYGREITHIVSDTALLLLLEGAARERSTLLHRCVQKGIDYYAIVQSNDHLWIANGGHNSGRKWPILFAGLLLNHPGMMNVKATFQEDQQTYYARQFHGRPVADKVAVWRITVGNPNKNHEEVAPDTWAAYGKGDNNGTKAEGYRKLNGPTWVGQALAARLTGMCEHWNHPPFFDYVDRWWRETQSAKPFVKAMWEKYRALADEIGGAARQKRETPGK